MLADHPDLEVIFCCFSSGDKAVYEELFPDSILRNRHLMPDL